MIAKEQLIMRLKQYITNQIAQISKDNPIIAFIKPLLDRALDKNFNKINSYLSLISDDCGNIEIGNSQIKINIPFTDKRLVFNHQDLQILKQSLIGEDCITNINE